MHIRNRVYLVSDRIGVYRIPDNMRLGRSKQDLFQTFLTNEACRQAFQSALCDQYHMHRAWSGRTAQKYSNTIVIEPRKCTSRPHSLHRVIWHIILLPHHHNSNAQPTITSDYHWLTARTWEFTTCLYACDAVCLPPSPLFPRPSPVLLSPAVRPIHWDVGIRFETWLATYWLHDQSNSLWHQCLSNDTLSMVSTSLHQHIYTWLQDWHTPSLIGYIQLTSWHRNAS